MKLSAIPAFKVEDSSFLTHASEGWRGHGTSIAAV